MDFKLRLVLRTFFYDKNRGLIHYLLNNISFHCELPISTQCVLHIDCRSYNEYAYNVYRVYTIDCMKNNILRI